jgi:hypothetical protein
MTRDIARADVQLLANREQVVQFFYTLGFDGTSRTTLTAGSLDIKGDLRDEIVAIERVGMLTDETWTLEVYLFEVRSITKAVRDGLARAFRNRTHLEQVQERMCRNPIAHIIILLSPHSLILLQSNPQGEHQVL